MNNPTEMYLVGISEGRATFNNEGLTDAAERIRNLKETIKGFAANSSVGQMLRGERDFWINQLKKVSK